MSIGNKTRTCNSWFSCDVTYGMSSSVAAPYKTLFIILEILKFLNYGFFAKIMTRKPKIGNLTNTTELYPFLESKKWQLLCKGILWSRDLFSGKNQVPLDQMINVFTASISIYLKLVSCNSRYSLFLLMELSSAEAPPAHPWQESELSRRQAVSYPLLSSKYRLGCIIM